MWFLLQPRRETSCWGGSGLGTGTALATGGQDTGHDGREIDGPTTARTTKAVFAQNNQLLKFHTHRYAGGGKKKKRHTVIPVPAFENPKCTIDSQDKNRQSESGTHPRRDDNHVTDGLAIGCQSHLVNVCPVISDQGACSCLSIRYDKIMPESTRDNAS